ncbi:MAG TPA: RNA polymerase sigma factor [Bacteroidota bacterium]|nr:RNA polymerase sigma factor [Bacteroidota bacterium]
MEKDRTTFTQLYKQYAGDVYRFSFWLSGDTALAKDITSETFVRVWTSESGIHFDTVKAYLFAIARNLYLHSKRRQKKLTRLDEDLMDNAHQPDELLSNKSELERTLKTLHTFPEIDRAVLLMRAEEQMSYEEIARSTGLSISAVKVKVFRTRAKLQQLLKSTKGAS